MTDRVATYVGIWATSDGYRWALHRGSRRIRRSLHADPDLDAVLRDIAQRCPGVDIHLPDGTWIRTGHDAP
jgi:hypothetical protein